MSLCIYFDHLNIQVNENGLLSFLTEIPSFFNVQFPLDYPLLAALYSDVDCREAGEVWYAGNLRWLELVRETERVRGTKLEDDV